MQRNTVQVKRVLEKSSSNRWVLLNRALDQSIEEEHSAWTGLERLARREQETPLNSSEKKQKKILSRKFSKAWSARKDAEISLEYLR